MREREREREREKEREKMREREREILHTYTILYSKYTLAYVMAPTEKDLHVQADHIVC